MAMGLTVNVMQTVSLMGMMTVLWPQRLVTKPKAGKLLFFMFYHVVIISYLRFFRVFPGPANLFVAILRG